MRTNLLDQKTLRHYLLGELKTEEQQQWELRLMTDTSCFEEIQMAEDDLIDKYLQEKLTPHEKERFDTFFLASPERCQKLSFARALKRFIESYQPKKQPSFFSRVLEPLKFWQWENPGTAWSLAAACLLLVIVGGTLSVVQIRTDRQQLAQFRARQAQPSEETTQLRQQLDQLQSHNSEMAASLKSEQDQLDQLSQQLSRLKPKEKRGEGGTTRLQTASLFSFALMPGLVRDSGISNRLSIPTGAKLVQIQFSLDTEGYPKYRAVLQTLNEVELWMQDWPRSSHSGTIIPMQVVLPAELLIPGDYKLKLAGINSNGNWEDIENYYFRVGSGSAAFSK
jgi:hypothetical protein